MLYTQNNQANILLDKIINHCMHLILLYCNPNTVLLAGSYARGEGIVKVKRGNIIFVSDLDIYLIGNRSLKRLVHKTKKEVNYVLSNLYAKHIDPRFIEEHKDFVDIQFMSIHNQHDDLSTMDLKYQTKLLYGSPVADLININEERALKTSLRFLMAKSKYLMYINDSTPKDEVILSCARTYAEIVTVLCTYTAGIYRPTYLERCKVIERIRFKGLDKDLKKRAMHFTMYRLGYKKIFRQTPQQIFKQTLDDLFSIWSIILHIPKEEVIKGGHLFQERLTEAFFEPFLEEALDKTLGIQRLIFKRFLLFVVQLYDLIPFLILLKKKKIQNVYIGGVISPYILIYQKIINTLSSFEYNTNTQLPFLWDLNARRRYHF